MRNCAARLLAIAILSNLTLACDGSDSEQDQARDTNTASLPTVTLEADTTEVDSGGEATLSWSSTNATECVASGGWSGMRGLAGNEGTGSLTGTQVFTISCSGPEGSADASVTIGVNRQPTVTLAADDATVTVGGSTTLRWSGEGVTSCEATGAWSGSRPTSGVESIGPLNQTASYSLTCSGPRGTAMAMTAIEAVHSVSLSWRAPTNNTDGSPVRNLNGYRVYVGAATRTYGSPILVRGAGQTSLVLKLASGIHYVAATATTSTGLESDYSEEILITVD